MTLLPHWIDFFDDLQHIRGRSQNTVLAYKRDLELYAEYSKNSSSILGFYEYMKKCGLSNRSQARVISSLRTYFKFCETKGTPAPELRELKPPKIKVGLPKVLNINEYDQLFNSCTVPDNDRTSRNQMTLMLLFGLGCRVSELIGLNLDDYNQTDRWIRILGKGNKERIVPLTDYLVKNLNHYILNIRPHLLDEKTNAVLINDRGHRPSRVDIWRWLAAWSTRAGFESPVSPHRFRHGCATALLESGADLRSIQVLLGHSSIQTTQIYTSVSTQNMKKTIDQFHPLSETSNKSGNGTDHSGSII